MNCQDARELVHAYADDELDVVTARDLDGHLHACPSCRRAFEAARAVKVAVAAPALYFPAPAGLRERVLASTASRRSDAGARPWWRTPRLAAGLAASVLVVCLAALAVLFDGRTRQSAQLALDLDEQGVLDSHVRSLQGPEDSHLYDVKSTDRHTVKPWFDRHVDFSPAVKQLAADGYPLLGGRLDYLHGHPVAALVYGRMKHTINLFVWPGGSGRGGETSSRRGFNLVHWSTGGMTYWAVSDLNAAELRQFVALVRDDAAPTTGPR